MENFNGLTPAETERLSILAEECGEVVQVVGKILRHGYNGTRPATDLTNRELLEMELGDVFHMTSRMDDAADISKFEIKRRMNEKAERIGRYLHHQ